MQKTSIKYSTYKVNKIEEINLQKDLIDLSICHWWLNLWKKIVLVYYAKKHVIA